MFGSNMSGHTTEVFLGNFSICMAFGPGLYKSRRYLGYQNEGWKALHRRKRSADSRFMTLNWLPFTATLSRNRRDSYT